MKAFEAAKIVSGELAGDGEIEIEGVGSLEEAGKREIAFIVDEKHLSGIEKSKSECVLAPLSIKGRVNKKAVIYVDDPYRSFVYLINKLVPEKKIEPGIHSTCVLGKNIRIGKNVYLGPYTVIGDDVEISDNVVVSGLCFIADGVRIGESTHIHSRVTLQDGSIIGKNVCIHPGVVIGSDGFGYLQREGKHIKIPQKGIVNIKDGVEIGSNSAIDRAAFKETNICKDTKIDNLVHIAHNASIGEDCLIIAQTGIGGSVNIGNGVIISGQVAVTDHVDVGDKVIIGGQAGVTKSIPSNKIYWGTPAKPIKEIKEQIALVNRLKEMKKRIKNLEEKISNMEKEG